MVRKPSTSIKQILVRDYNWRIGNLRRLQMCSRVLDADLSREVEECVYQQIGREKINHHLRLAFLVHGDPMKGGYDDVYEDARHEVEWNKRQIAGDRKNPS